MSDVAARLPLPPAAGTLPSNHTNQLRRKSVGLMMMGAPGVVIGDVGGYVEV